MGAGLAGGLATVLVRGNWGGLFSRDMGVVRGVRDAMLWMGILEVVNFPLAVCGGIVRGTARPWLAMYANISGFYFLALPLGVVLAFKVHMGVRGLLIGFMVGLLCCLILLVVLILRINWTDEANKAQRLAADCDKDVGCKASAIADNIASA